MKNIIIFGLNDIAEIAYTYLKYEKNITVTAFCVHKKYLPKEKLFHGLPIVAFEEVEHIFPNDKHIFFSPMASSKMNTLRQRVYQDIKEKGYDFYSFVSKEASVQKNVSIGENCFICPGVTIDPFVKIGNNVMIWGNSYIGHHSKIGNHVCITGQVAITGNCTIGDNSFLGANSTLRNGIILAEGTLLSLSSVLTKNTEKWSVYMGNPAKRIGKGISKSILHI